MATTLELAYEHCRHVAKEQARNFYYAFRTLPAHKRRAIYAVYAFCRYCDDIADEPLPADERPRRFGLVREMLSSFDSGDAADPLFAALQDASRTFEIPASYYSEIVDGVEMDLTWTRFRDFDELRAYCYKVASVVGLICVEIFGYKDARAREYAVDLGIAMQLTNILRDIREDADRGRIYIPQDELERFGYSEAEADRRGCQQRVPCADGVPGGKSEALLRQRRAPDASAVAGFSGVSGRAARSLQDPSGSHRGRRLRCLRAPHQTQLGREVLSGCQDLGIKRGPGSANPSQVTCSTAVG